MLLALLLHKASPASAHPGMLLPLQTNKCQSCINQTQQSRTMMRRTPADFPLKNTPRRILTNIERPGDEAKQVLSKLENLPLAPFPAAHLWASGGRDGGGGGGEGQARVGQVCGVEKDKSAKNRRRVEHPRGSRTFGKSSAAGPAPGSERGVSPSPSPACVSVCLHSWSVRHRGGPALLCSGH